MQTSIESLFIAEVLVEYHILGCQYGFTTYIIRIHAFPSARNRTTVEDHHQVVIVGITQDIFIQAHRLLLVATKEIDFNAFYSEVL